MRRLLILFICILLFTLPLNGCSRTINSNDDSKGNSIAISDSSNIENDNKKNTVLLDLKDNLDDTDKYNGESYDLKKVNDGFADGNLEFAFNIFKKLSEEDVETNIFISPLSISQVLSMAYNGAGSSTKEVMEKVLGFSGLDITAVNESSKNLINYLNQIDEKIELNIANSIWVSNDTDIKEDFLMTNEDNYNAKVDTLDFTDPTSLDVINNWIKEATKDKIKKMLEPPVPEDAIMYLVNAIYFKGEWSNQFNPDLTYESDFTTLDGTTLQVNMMTRSKNDVDYMGNDNFQAVRLPYGKGKISMYIILPKEGININDFIEDLDISKWNGIKKTVKEENDILLAIPKFKLEYGIKDLKNCLTNLGMGEVFNDNADFSGIGDNIRISRLLHKAIIEVNEEGSEAAAVTVGEMVTTGFMAEPIRFIVDRPFMFIINDDVTDTILFMGKVVSIGE